MDELHKKEVLGDWNNLKGTRYHLVYAIWLLLRGEASQMAFYRGNDLWAQPAPPPASALDQEVMATATSTDGETDIWIQLKSTEIPWTRSRLLDEKNLVFNFICNAVVSEQRGRKWLPSLITEADIRSDEIKEFASSPNSYPELSSKLNTILHRSQKHLVDAGHVIQLDRLNDFAKAILLRIAATEPVPLRALKAEVETELAFACPCPESVSRVASTLVGALVLDAGAGPDAAHPYTVEWLNREAGVTIKSDRPFDTDVALACDLSVRDAFSEISSTQFQPDRCVPRQPLFALLRQFLGAEESLFVLLGRSGTGKSWAVADWMARELAGAVRLLVTGQALRPESTLGSLAADALVRFSARPWRPHEFLSRAVAAASASATTRAPLVLAIDDIRATPETAAEYRQLLPRLTREARKINGKLLLTSQSESWALFGLGTEVPQGEIFSPLRGRASAPITFSASLDEFSPEELEAAVRLRLPPLRAERAALQLRNPAFALLRNPSYLERYVEQHGMSLGVMSTSPDPVEVDRLIAATIEQRLTRVAAALSTDIDSVRAAFETLIAQLWALRSADTSSFVVAANLSRALPGIEQQAFAAFRQVGLLTASGPVRWVDGITADHVYAGHMLSRIAREGDTPLNDLDPTLDPTVAEALVRVAPNGPELADRLIRMDARWRPAAARGLAQRPASEHRSVAVAQSLTRPFSERFVDGVGCECFGMLAARGGRGISAGRAWRRVAEMYMNGDSVESLRGMHALATALNYVPRRVGRLVRLRLRREGRCLDDNRRKTAGRRLGKALAALHGLSHREAARVACEILEEVEALATRESPTDLEALLDDVDYVRGRAAVYLGEDRLAGLLDELRSKDRATRLRSARAVRPAVYELPGRTGPSLIAAIRDESDPDVLLRLLWASHPLLAASVDSLLAAIEASPVVRWDNPVPLGPALAILGEAAAHRPSQVAKILPRRLDGIPPWARACLSDVFALAWWRCADRLPRERTALEALADPDLGHLPRAFHVFAYRGAFVARLGLACLSQLWPFDFGVSMMTHFPGQLPYCYSDLDEFLDPVAPKVLTAPDSPRILEMLTACIQAGSQDLRLFRGRTLENARFMCARQSVDDLAAFALPQTDPMALLRELPRDWQSVRAARLLIERGCRLPAVLAFAQAACDEHAQGGTLNARSERGRCLAELARNNPVPLAALVQNQAAVGPSADFFRADEHADGMTVLADQNPNYSLPLLDQAIPDGSSIPKLYHWAKKARSWQSVLLSGVYARMFDPRPIGRTSAIRMVTDVLEVARSLPTTLDQQEYLAVYTAVLAWLETGPARPQFASQQETPIRVSHLHAAQLLERAAASPRSSAWIQQFLCDRVFWWECPYLRWSQESLDFGLGGDTYLVYAFPAFRLSCLAATTGSRFSDPCAVFMTARHRVSSELSDINSSLRRAGDRHDRLEQILSRLHELVSATPLDERLAVMRGNLLLRLGRFADAEDDLRRGLASRMCSADTRASGLYDLACVAARTDRSEESGQLLGEAIRLRPAMKEQLEGDPDFSSVRDSTWFRELALRPPA